MENTQLEETLDNLGEPIPTAEPQPEPPQPSQVEKPANELEETNKRLFARAKKAEEENKKLQEELKRKNLDPVSDVDRILEVQSATQGLTPDEVEELKLRADSKRMSLSEARNDKNFVLWQQAYREKVEKDKTLSPSTRQESGPRTVSPDEFVSTASDEEVEKWMVENGLWKPPHRRHNPKAFNSNY